MRSDRRTMCGMHALWLLLAMCVAVTAAHADEVTVRAHLDRDRVQMGSLVTLTVNVDGTAQAARPDLAALHSDFDIVGTSSSSSVRIVHGQRSTRIQWAIRLRPRHAGQLVIPALEVDGHATAPLTLTVDAGSASASASVRGSPGDPVFIRVVPSTRTPYVGQQIDLAVKLFYAPNIGSGSFEPPRGKGVDVSSLGNGTRYQSTHDGRRYRVLERHYAVTAKHAGPINLAPVTFEGRVGTGLAALFGNAHAVSARSAPIRLAVRSRPASAGKGVWLPARDLTLHLTGLPASGQVQVGQSLTLTLTEKAVGLPFDVLPEPQLPTLQGVDVYPGQSDDHTGNDGHWLHGVRQRRFALVPQQSGTLTIPAITLKWWNVETGKAEVARIPARTLSVVAGSANTRVAPAPAASAPAAAATPGAVASPHAHKQADAPVAVASSNHSLIWLALGLLLSGALGLLAFGYGRRRRRARSVGAGKAGASATSRRARRAFFRAVRHGSVATQCETLLAWARTERPQLLHLGELCGALDSAQQRDAVTRMQRARYAGNGAPIDADELMTVFRGGLTWRRIVSSDASASALPPLYP